VRTCFRILANQDKRSYSCAWSLWLPLQADRRIRIGHRGSLKPPALRCRLYTTRHLIPRQTPKFFEVSTSLPRKAHQVNFVPWHFLSCSRWCSPHRHLDPLAHWKCVLYGGWPNAERYHRKRKWWAWRDQLRCWEASTGPHRHQTGACSCGKILKKTRWRSSCCSGDQFPQKQLY